MGKRKHESLAEVLERPWCYYCERDFDNDKVLVDHQKAKHFQCRFGTCHRRLNTVGGLRVHMAQVHKAELDEVPNAIEKRKDLNIEIFGMLGIPASLIEARNAIVRSAYEEMEAEHVARTGNPLPGSEAAKARNEEAREAKKPKIESKEELRARLAEAKAKLAAKRAAAAAGLPPPSQSSTPPAAATPQNMQGITTQNTATPPGMTAFAAPPPSLSSPMTRLPPGVPHPFPPGMSPAYGGRTLPPGAPPGLSMSSSNGSSTLPMAGGFTTPSTRTSPNGDTPELGTATLSDSHPAPPMTSTEVNSQINYMWDMLEQQQAAGIANPQVLGVNPPDSNPAPKERTKEKAAGKQAQHSILQIRDNHVSPEEKRARAERYQPKQKTSTMPTSTPTQGVTGAVDAPNS